MSDPAPARPSFAAWGAGGYANAAVPRPADPASLQTLAGRTMGTTWSVRFDNPAMLARDAVRAAIEQALDDVVADMSTWEPTSGISRYNDAPAGSRHTVSRSFAEVLGCALQWAAASKGAVDPTVGPLVAAWGFGAHAAHQDETVGLPPSPAARAAAQGRVGWQRLEFDVRTRTLVQPGGVSLDFSGIAKGFAVDQVVEALIALGLHNALVEVGGELRGIGCRPGGQPWRVQIDGLADAVPPVALAGNAVATSGDRWHAHAHGGRRWSHTIDPRTGEPASDALASVTVLHPRCMHADALATVLTVLGDVDGPAFAERHGVAALFLARSGGTERVLASAAWQARVE